MLDSCGTVLSTFWHSHAERLLRRPVGCAHRQGVNFYAAVSLSRSASLSWTFLRLHLVQPGDNCSGAGSVPFFAHRQTVDLSTS